MTEPRTIVFFPEGAFGPTNNCVGIGSVLRERGHRVVFIVEESFAGTLEAKGFEERLMRLGPPPEVPEVPGQFWKDFIRDTAPVFRTPTIEQLGGFIQPTWQALIDGAKYVHPRLLEIFDELDPDVIVEDNVVAFPALPASGRRWVRITSCNPAELLDPDVPPVFSGYPTADRSGWPAFRAEYRRSHAELWADFDAFCRDHGAPGLPDGPEGPAFIHESPYLNLYLYPAEVDYGRARPLAPTWHRLDSCVRTTEGAWAIPESLAEPAGRARLPQPGEPRLGRRRADAPAGRRPRPDAVPVRRLEGPAARPVRAGRQHGRGRVPARSPRSCPRSTWSSPTAATTPSPSASTTASR